MAEIDPFNIDRFDIPEEEEDEEEEERRRRQATEVPPARPSFPQRVLQTDVPGTDLSIGDVAEQLLEGFAEPARTASAIIGGAGQSIGRGATAIGAGVLSMLRGDQTTTPTVRRAVGKFQEATDPFVAQPRSLVGKQTVQTAALPFSLAGKGLEFAGLTEEQAQNALDVGGLFLAGPHITKAAGKTGKAVFRELRDLGERGEVTIKPGETAGISNAAIDAARAEAGLRPAKHVEAIKFSEELAKAAEREKANPGEARRLAKRLVKDPRELSKKDVADLINEEARLQVQLERAKDKLNETKGDKDAVAEAEATIAELEQEFQDVGDVSTQGGALQAQAFGLRKAQQNKDYSHAAMTRDSSTP